MQGGREKDVGTILSGGGGGGMDPSPVDTSLLPTLPDQEGTAALRPASSHRAFSTRESSWQPQGPAE